MYHAVQYAMIIGEFLKMFWKCLVILHYSCWHGTESQKVGPLNKSGCLYFHPGGFLPPPKKTQKMRKCRCIINPRSQNQAHGRQLPCPMSSWSHGRKLHILPNKTMLYPASRSFECWGKFMEIHPISFMHSFVGISKQIHRFKIYSCATLSCEIFCMSHV